MLKKITTLVCIGLLMNLLFCSNTFANDGERGRASKIRSKILSLGKGKETRIEVTLYNKTKIKGYISEADEDGFTVINTDNNQATKVSYPDVKKASGRNNLNGRWIAVGFVLVVLVGIILFAAVSSDY